MRKVIIIVGSIFVVLLIMIGVLVLNNPFLSIELKGKKKSVIEVNTKYKDPEVKALLLNKNISTNIKIKSNLNTRKLGKYKITYLVKYLKTVKKVSRQVEVVDTTKPVIELIGDDLITLNKGDDYQEPGVKVSDNYNNDLNNKVEILSNLDTNIVGEYEITYKVKDSSNNEVSIKRRVVVKEGLKNNKYVMNDSGGQVTNDTVAPTYIKGILLVNKKY